MAGIGIIRDSATQVRLRSVPDDNITAHTTYTGFLNASPEGDQVELLRYNGSVLAAASPGLSAPEALRSFRPLPLNSQILQIGDVTVHTGTATINEQGLLLSPPDNGYSHVSLDFLYSPGYLGIDGLCGWAVEFDLVPPGTPANGHEFMAGIVAREPGTSYDYSQAWLCVNHTGAVWETSWCGATGGPYADFATGYAALSRSSNTTLSGGPSAGLIWQSMGVNNATPYVAWTAQLGLAGYENDSAKVKRGGISAGGFRITQPDAIRGPSLELIAKRPAGGAAMPVVVKRVWVAAQPITE